MPNINIKIRNKVAKGEYAVIVCDNSDYIAHFDFDAEWDEYTTKTARFVYGGRYTDVVFSGNECAVPVMQDTRAVTVGVFAGDLHTTTPAYFACVPSILCCNGIPADPTPDVYAQIMELLNNISLGGNPATTETLGLIKVGENLKITADGVLSVDTATQVQPDWKQNNSTQPDYIKNRPFYTGNPVETVLVEESTVSFAEDRGLYVAQIQSSFAATIGETYKVYWDGAAYECACVNINNNSIIGNLSITGDGSDTGEPFLIVVNPGEGILILTADTSASHTVSISATAVVVVKIDAKYLPDTVATKSDVEVARTTANNAQATANTAKTTAENAQTTANNAQTTANAAQTAAENAQTTANAAQTAAENAQTAANAALERTVEPYTKNAQMAPLYKNGGFSAWREVVQNISYNETEGYFFVNGLDTTAFKGEDMPDGVFCVCVYVGNQSAMAFLTKYIHAAGSGSWSVRGFAVIIDEYSRTGEVLYVSSNAIPQNEAKGLFLTFRAPNSMLLKSSTANSTKQFRITVDDSGVITATEVS